MATPNDSKRKENSLAIPDTILLSTEEKIIFIARLIADRIAEDEVSGFEFLQTIKDDYGT